MRGVVVTQPGGPEMLAWGEVAEPELKAGEVLLEVAATAVNRADLLQRIGVYNPPPGSSDVLGLECSGTIAAIGEGVTGWNVGDEVCALMTGGGYAERVAVPAVQLLPIPSGVSLIEAAALPEVTCTVWSSVFDVGRLAPGESFLVHGGTSGIGTMATQLAHAHGARVFATAGSDEKVAACAKFGTDVGINYRTQDFAEVIAAETGGKGVDVILDTIGAKYLGPNLNALATGGRLTMIGLLGGIKAELNLAQVLYKRATLYGSTLRARPVDEKAQIVAGTRAFVWPLIEKGAVTPVVHTTMPMSAAAEAHRMVEASEHIGKVVLTRG
jgi:putative PIG3 family NAD(P)H quinone oxidoreductase